MTLFLMHTCRYGRRGLLMDVLKAALLQLVAVDKELTQRYPVLYHTGKVMALSLLSYRLFQLASLLFLFYKSDYYTNCHDTFVHSLLRSVELVLFW